MSKKRLYNMLGQPLRHRGQISVGDEIYYSPPPSTMFHGIIRSINKNKGTVENKVDATDVNDITFTKEEGWRWTDHEGYSYE